jgi:hypothetical protein
MPVQTRIAYCRDLVGAAFDGILSVRPLDAAPWTPAAIGAAVGALGAGLFTRRRARSSVATGSLLGTIVGCGAAVAWASRASLIPALRIAGRRVHTVRDAHWLAQHPIDYA